MTADIEGAAAAYYRLWAAGGDGPEPSREVGQALWWSWEWVQQRVFDAPGAAVEVMDRLLHEPGCEDAFLACVGSGPLQDLLADALHQVGEQVAAHCRHESVWAEAARSVWLDRTQWAELPKELQKLIPEPMPDPNSKPKKRRAW